MLKMFVKKSETRNAENVWIEAKYKKRKHKELAGARTQNNTLSLEAKMAFLTNLQNAHGHCAGLWQAQHTYASYPDRLVAHWKRQKQRKHTQKVREINY